MKTGAALLLFLWVLILPAFAGQQATYVIGMPCLTVPDCQSPELEAFMREAYRRIGAQVRFKYLPMLRALEEADDGTIDACMLRTRDTIGKYSGLMAVEAPVAVDTLVAFTVKKGLQVKSWEDLRQLSVGTVRGMRTPIEVSEQNGLRPHLINDAKQAFAMLEHGRLDALLVNFTYGDSIAKSLGVKAYTSPPLNTVPLHHAINRKHADIEPALSEAFKGMLEDGTAKRLLGDWSTALGQNPAE